MGSVVRGAIFRDGVEVETQAQSAA